MALRLPRVDWTTRRYRMDTFDRKQVKAGLKAWVRARGFRIYSMPKVDLRKRYWSTAYVIARSRWSLLTRMTIAMYVSYRGPLLYVFSTSRLPPEMSPIHDEYFGAYARSQGGHVLEETPLAFSTSYFMTSPVSRFESLKVDYSLLVSLDHQNARVEAATEDVRVPVGVTVSIKRSRTITRAVELTESETNRRQVEAGVKIGQLDILKATVLSEIQRRAGRTFETSETVEYNIALSGDKSPAYRLVWADIVKSGVVEIRGAGDVQSIPFSFRERTELDVLAAAGDFEGGQVQHGDAGAV